MKLAEYDNSRAIRHGADRLANESDNPNWFREELFAEEKLNPPSWESLVPAIKAGDPDAFIEGCYRQSINRGKQGADKFVDIEPVGIRANTGHTGTFSAYRVETEESLEDRLGRLQGRNRNFEDGSRTSEPMRHTLREQLLHPERTKNADIIRAMRIAKFLPWVFFRPGASEEEPISERLKRINTVSSELVELLALDPSFEEQNLYLLKVRASVEDAVFPSILHANNWKLNPYFKTYPESAGHGWTRFEDGSEGAAEVLLPNTIFLDPNVPFVVRYYHHTLPGWGSA